MKLINIEEIIVCSISEVAAFRHCKKLLNNTSQRTALRTNDFLITNLAMDYDAQILTFDEAMWNKTRRIYSFIYYFKDKDEENRFFNDFKNSVDPYIPF